MGNAQTELGYPLPYPADWYYIRPSYPPVTSQDVTEFGILCAVLESNWECRGSRNRLGT